MFASLVLAGTAQAAPSDRYVIHNVWSNNFTTWPADVLDARLVNPWGLAASAGSPWWPVNNGNNSSTINSAAGGAVNVGTLANLPVPTGGVAGAGGTTFSVTPPGGTAGASNFIFSSMNGGIYGWRGGLPSNNAIQGFSKAGAFYTGLAIATVAGAPRLYAPDYRQARIDIVSSTWGQLPDAFVDPTLPAGYSPWGIQTIGTRIYVAYAKQTAPLNPAYRSGIGAGNGVVDAFDTSGTFVSRVASPGGALNAPWGLALAPTNFGAYGGDLLVGNFGDGKINAYHENADGTWTQSGVLKNPDGSALVLPGLWALEPGNGNAGSGQRYQVFYTAGGADEHSGVLGRIMANPGDVTGTVPATLSLTMGNPAAFGSFVPGVGADYTATTTATVVSSAGDAALSVADPSATATGHLVNGTFSLPQAVMVNATSPGGGTGGALAALGGSASPNTLITYTGPISNDIVTVNFKQTIGSTDPLRTGAYSKTLTFTLSTTTP